MGVLRFLLRATCLLLILLLALRCTLHLASSSSDVFQRCRSARWYHQERTHEQEFQSRASRGGGGENTFYESVTYKLIGPYTDDIILITPGLFLNRAEPGKSEAFVDVVFNTKVHHYRFPVSQYQSVQQADGFTIHVGDSTFTPSAITLSIMQDEDDTAEESTIIGEIQLAELKEWPQSLLHPGTDGFLSFFTSLLPSTPTTQHVLSLHHRLHGYISVGELLTDLEQGTGSTTKYFGSHLPSSWVTAHSNHFALLKPPKRGGGAGSAGEGEVWAEQEENTEETAEEGPGAGHSSGAISALYADHIHNHEQPVALYVNIPRWSRNALLGGAAAATNDEDDDSPSESSFLSFTIGFLYDRTTHLFTSSRLDHLVRFDLEVSEKDNDKEIIHVTTVSHDYTRQLHLSLHKPVQINAAGRRKKDTACLKKVIAQKNREKARMGGNLNPLEEAFLMEKAKADAEPSAPAESPEVAAAMKAALEAGIAAEKANTPEAKLQALYEKPIATPAPIVSGQYAPDGKTGQLVKGAREALIGGRIELQWSELLTASSYAALSSKQKKAEDWKQQIVGDQVMYARQIYRAIGKPATMETVGDVEAMMEEFAAWNRDWKKQAIEAASKPVNALIAIGVLVGLFILLGKLGTSKPSADAKLKSQ
jgi:hypothetical protein